MTMIYSNPAREQEDGALPDVEVFHIRADFRKVPAFAAHFDCPLCGDPSQLVTADQQAAIDEHNTKHVGWWWEHVILLSLGSVSMPDGDPVGPFDTEADAIACAQDGSHKDTGAGAGAGAGALCLICGDLAEELLLCGVHLNGYFNWKRRDGDDTPANRVAEFVRLPLCPICGERISLTGRTTDGRLIGSCGDAFTREQWDDPPQDDDDDGVDASDTDGYGAHNASQDTDCHPDCGPIVAREGGYHVHENEDGRCTYADNGPDDYPTSGYCGGVLVGEELPPCVLAMRCYCAGHARGNPVSEPCDTTETANGPCTHHGAPRPKCHENGCVPCGTAHTPTDDRCTVHGSTPCRCGEPVPSEVRL